jgi:hypothetical protein
MVLKFVDKGALYSKDNFFLWIHTTDNICRTFSKIQKKGNVQHNGKTKHTQKKVVGILCL